jgi:ribosomal protein S14
MYPLSAVELVRELDQQGLSKNAIARTTGVSRAAIRSWLSGTIPGVKMAARSSASSCRRCGTAQMQFPRLTDAAYSYLLGMYLGDGHVSDSRKGVKRLRVSVARRASVELMDEHIGPKR